MCINGKGIKKAIFVIGIFSLTTILGCDKIPFLAKYFPSVKKEGNKPPSQSTPAVSAPTATGTAPNVLAKVGGWSITVEEFNDRLKSLKDALPEYDITKADSKKLVLEELIRQQLLIQDAEASGLAQKKDVVEAVEEFRKTILVREMATKITENVQSTDADAQEYYDKNKSSFTKPTQWHLREITVPTQDEAKEALIELLKGADFAATAQARSKAPTAAQGGDLGLLTDEKINPETKAAIATLEVGNVSSVFKNVDGYSVVKLEEKKGGEQIAFDEVKNDVKAGLTLMKQQQKVLDYIDGLKKKVAIEVHEDLLK